VRVGFFVVVVLAVAAYIVLSIEGNPFEDTFSIKAHYTRVSGVKPGTVVTLAGHQIGQVEKVQPNPELRKVEVWMAVNEEWAGAILSDATASIVPLGFLGDVMIELTYGRMGFPVESGEVLRGVEPLDWQSLIKDAAGEFKNAMGSVDEVVGNESYQEDLGKILDNLADFSETLNTIVVPEDKQDIDELFGLLKQTTANVGTAAESLNRLIEDNRENLTASVGNVRTITDQVKEDIAPDFAAASRGFADLSKQLSSLTEKIDKLVENNSDNTTEMIANIKTAAESFDQTLQSARTSLERIEQGPGTLHEIIYRDETSRELNSTLRSARGFFDQFAGLGEGLELKVSAETQWFFDDPEDDHSHHDFLVTTNPPPISVEGTYDAWYPADDNRLEMDLHGQIFFDNYGLLIGADDVGTDPSLDLLFLGKIPNTGDRLQAGFGVLEGKAGARLEAHLVPDLLSLRLDAIGFTTDDEERLDISMRAQIWENIHLLGGIEGVIGTPRTRGFAGVRIEFGKKFGQDDALVEEAWSPAYDDSTYDELFDSPPPAPSGPPPSRPAPSGNPFAEDESLWQETIQQEEPEMIPADEAPSRPAQ
jgi:phospholipid/cholesterol/gamma-HCH transport system substrate-binding protein